MSPRVKSLKVIFTCLEEDEQGVLNDVDDLELEESSAPNDIKLFCEEVLTLEDCAALDLSPTVLIH